MLWWGPKQFFFLMGIEMGGEDCKWITKGPPGGPVAPACVVPCWLILGWCQQTRFTLSLYHCLPQCSSLLPPHHTPPHSLHFPHSPCFLSSHFTSWHSCWYLGNPCPTLFSCITNPHPLPRAPSLQGHFCFLCRSSPGHSLCQPKEQRMPTSPHWLEVGLSVLRAGL